MGAAKYISQLKVNLKKLTDKITIVEDFNALLTAMDRSSKQKINKETRALNGSLEQMDLTDLFRAVILKQQNTNSFQVHTSNIIQNRLHTGSQIRPQPVQKD